MSDQYFASLPQDELGYEVMGKIEHWAHNVNRNGLKFKWLKSYRMYYGRHWKGDPSFRDSEILHTGEDGELSALTVNDYRNLIKHMLVLTTNQRPAFDPRATNTDASSMTQTRLAKNILDYYVRDKRMGRYLKDAAEQALVFGKSFVKVVWDKSLGQPYASQEVQNENGEPTQKLVYEGDVKISLLDPFSVFVDQSVENWEQVQWVITREWVNKWDMVARYPQFATQIQNIAVKSDVQGFNYIAMQTIEDTDLIPVYQFYHLRSDSMKNGRFFECLSPDVVTYDGPIPYDKLPVFRIVAGNYYGSTEGYTDAFDIMNLQQAQNVSWSTIYSNLSTFGVQNVLVPDGCNISTLQIAQALRTIKFNPAAGKPEALQLTAIPKEAFTFSDMVSSKMETVFGMNAVSRGNPEEDMSGKALGLLQSMAIQYASGFQESYAQLSEDVATFILKLIAAFATTQRIISVAGKFNKGDLVQFTGQDLSNIDRVVVDLGNPMSKTLAGRLEVAKDLIANGLIKDPRQYFEVLETGNLEAMTESAESALALVRSEREALQDGQPVMAMIFDPHLLHIKEHLSLISKNDVRSNSPIVQGVLAHVQEHKNMWAQTGLDPVTAQLYNAVTGEPPGPPPPMPMMPPGAPMPPHPRPGQPMHNAPPHPAPPKDLSNPPPGPQQGISPLPHGTPPPAPPGPEEALQQALR